jgi:hypothetical protein
MISRQVQSRRIKDKFEDLKMFPLEEYVGDDLRGEKHVPVANTELGTAVQVRVWKVLQTKFQDHGAGEKLRLFGWTDQHFNRSLNGTIMIEDEEMSVEDISPFCQAEFSENLHEEEYEGLFEDENYEEMFEDVPDSRFLIEEDEIKEHDASNDLLWDRNLAIEDRGYFNDLNWEPDQLLNFTSDAYRNTNCEQDSCDVSVESLPDHGPLFSDDYFWDQVLDVGHQRWQDVLDDSCLDEGTRVDFADEHGSHHELIMEN